MCHSKWIFLSLAFTSEGDDIEQLIFCVLLMLQRLVKSMQEPKYIVELYPTPQCC